MQTHKDQPDDNDSEPPHLQHKRGRKKSKQFRFGDGIDILSNHHQVVRSKLCTPKFFKNTSPHPGQKPKESNSTSDALRQWNKKSRKYAQLYLTLFFPEPKSLQKQTAYHTFL